MCILVTGTKNVLSSSFTVPSIIVADGIRLTESGEPPEPSRLSPT